MKRRPSWKCRTQAQGTIRQMANGESYGVIPLTKGMEATVDVADLECLAKYNWFLIPSRSTFYAIRHEVINGKRVTIRMHRQILDVASDEQVDHRSGNGLDNRRSNLRRCSASQNMCNKNAYRNNKSGFKGVIWDKVNKAWRATIRHKVLGLFKNPISAAKAYNEAAIRLFGEFANLNTIPNEQEVTL